MTFLAIVLAVLVFQAWGSAQRLHHDSWFTDWQARVANWGLSGSLALALLVLLPAVLVSFALDVVEPVLFGLLWLPLAAFLLLYSFGRGDFQASMSSYRGHAYSGDFEGAYLAACEDFGWDETIEAPETALEVHAMIQRALLYEGMQRWFAVLFYFVLLGPAGALVYRLLQLCRDTFEPDTAQRWLFLLDWVPARLLSATFTVTGDFIGSRDSLFAGLRDSGAQAGALLYRVGFDALGSRGFIDPDDDTVFGPEAAAQNREFNALLSRSAVGWIVVLALLVILF